MEWRAAEEAREIEREREREEEREAEERRREEEEELTKLEAAEKEESFQVRGIRGKRSEIVAHAACVLQSVWRGHEARSEVGTELRGRLERRRFEKEEAAATLIQKRARGMLGRARVRRMKQEQHMRGAVVTLERVYKGHLGRKIVMGMMLKIQTEASAIVTIQRWSSLPPLLLPASCPSSSVNVARLFPILPIFFDVSATSTGLSTPCR